MNEQAARVVGDGLLKGAFDVFDAMLSTTFDYTLEAPVALTADRAAALLGEFPVSMQGKIQNNLGSVALLFTVNDAARFAALIQEQEFTGATTLAEEDRAMLREIADPALGGGVTNLMERFGRNVEQLEEVQVLDGGDENAGALVTLIGLDGGAARFSFSDPSGMTGAGAALFSPSLITMVPEHLRSGKAGAPLATEPELSPDEMNDILSGFDSGPGATELGPGTASPLHGNLDMVLDIGLIATARLGHVEMPIGEIMNLGPGSIIEVGHLVDEPVDLLVNGKLIARGDVVVVDEKFGLRITEIVSPRARIESLR
jgi:flagellar motor switch protein FliN/FliY